MDLVSTIVRKIMEPRRASSTSPRSVPATWDSRRPQRNLSRRHSVATQPTSPRHATIPRTKSSVTLTDLRQVSWSEYTARRSLVQFRNRRQTSRDHETIFPPSELTMNMLCSQYELCRHTDRPLSGRIVAMLYCWYFGWITNIYNALTGGGRQRSLLKWILACVVVTVISVIFIGLLYLGVHACASFLTVMLHSAGAFLTLMCIAFVTILGISNICSYNSSNFYTEHSVH